MAYWMMGLPQLHVSRTSPLSSVPALRPLHLLWAGLCARVAQLQSWEGQLRAGSWCQFGRDGHTWQGRCHTGWRGERMSQRGKETEQLFLWKEEAFNYCIHLCQECCLRVLHDRLCLCITWGLSVCLKTILGATRPDYSGQQQHEWLCF